jgi:hypothetical protein
MSEFITKKYLSFKYFEAPQGGYWEGRETGTNHDAFVCRVHHYQTTVWVCEVAESLWLTVGLLQDIVDFMNEIKEKANDPRTD